VRTPLLALLLLAVPFAHAEEGDARAWHRLVGILQYLEGDYAGAVESQDAGELEEQRAFAKQAVEIAQGMGAPGAPFLPRLEALKARVDKAEDAPGVPRDCGALVADIVRTAGLKRSPHGVPDLGRGAKVFAESCASCHGADGRADTAVGKALVPPAANFHDAERMSTLTPYKAYNTTSFGIAGTGMAAFPQLSDADRWAVAFFLFTLRQPPCSGNPPRLDVDALANTTDAELEKAHGASAVACLRRVMPAADEQGSLAGARKNVHAAMDFGAAGKRDEAKQALLDAYLDGIEPVEPLLKARKPGLVQRIEQVFLQARTAAEAGSPELQGRGKELLGLLDEAEGRSSAPDAVSVFLQALFILLREGFEATVVIAALLAVLKKMKAPHLVRVVHAGWMSAAVVGALAFAFARHLVAGANREWMEGLVALAAVGMLLYAAFWLNSRAGTRKFMNELRGEVQGALGRGSVAGLFFISFSALLRESLETALFLQGLAIDSAAGAAWGAAAGLVALGGLVLFVNRVGYVLPMKTLFTASTWLLFLTAVMLLGKGLHALQEVGALPLRPLPVPGVELLGVYPDLVSLLPQLLLLLAPLPWLMRREGRGDSGPPATPPSPPAAA
jgi:high-affinity iron transporter